VIDRRAVLLGAAALAANSASAQELLGDDGKPAQTWQIGRAHV